VRARLILASGSPRRRELLAAEGVEFEVIAPAVTESASRSFSMRELTIRNAAHKAIAVAQLYPDAVVLGADTLVALDGEPIGKPSDMEEAENILRRLSGGEHQVCTAVYICLARPHRVKSFYAISHVQFHSLDQFQIRAYLAKIDPLDKAGAYAAQGSGAEIIKRIRGSYTNVVGLPMEETLPALREFGIA
jgi:septum formation protein